MKPVIAFRNVAHESLGMIEEVLRQAELTFSYLNLYESLPRTFDPHYLAGIIVLGGPMNVDETDRYPYLLPEQGFIRQAIDAGVPLLGICLGAQLLAKALGARVYAAPEKEIGWYSVQPTAAAADDPLLRHFRPQETVFQWHGDTFDLPAGAVHLAASRACAHQAFRFGDRTYGLQFHVEVTAELIDDWLTEPGGCREIEALNYIDPEEIRHRIQSELPAMHAMARPMFGQFAAWCRQRAEAG